MHVHQSKASPPPVRIAPDFLFDAVILVVNQLINGD